MPKKIVKSLPKQKPTKQAAATPRLSAARVLAFLVKHPEFLKTHATKLGGVKSPKKVANVFSLHAAKAESAEGKVAALKKRLQQTVAIARANAEATDQAHTAVLALMGATTSAQLGKALQGPFKAALGLDAVRLFRAAEQPGAMQLTPEAIHALCPQALQLGPVQAARHAEIFGPQLSGLQSCALLRLEGQNGDLLGLMALGSHNLHHFHAGQETSLLEFLRQALSRQWGSHG